MGDILDKYAKIPTISRIYYKKKNKNCNDIVDGHYEDKNGNIVEYWMGLEYPEKYKFVIDGYEESDEHLRKRILKRMRKFNAIK